jgi:hypothetical protein
MDPSVTVRAQQTHLPRRILPRLQTRKISEVVNLKVALAATVLAALTTSLYEIGKGVPSGVT